MREDTKRYNAVFPAKLFEQIQALADVQDTTIISLLCKFCKLGVMASNPNVKILLQSENETREIVLI